MSQRINDINLERLRETEIAMRFANLGFEKQRCPDCNGRGIDYEARERIKKMFPDESYIGVIECIPCCGTGHIWVKKDGEINTATEP